MAHLCGHKARIFGLGWRPAREGSAHALASASEDQSVVIWHLTAGDDGGLSHRKAHVLAEAHVSEVLRCEWSSTGRLLATGGADGAARIFAVPDDDALGAAPAARARLALREPAAGAAGGEDDEDAQVYGLAFAESDARLLVAAGSCVHAFDVPSGRRAATLALAPASAASGDFVFGGERNAACASYAFDLALSPDGALLALACSTGHARVLDARLRSADGAVLSVAGEAGVTVRAARGDFASACTFVSAAGQEASPLLFTACGSGACALWDVRMPLAPLARCSPHEGTAYCCAALGGGRVATVGRDRRLLLHDTRRAAAQAAAPGGGGAAHRETAERTIALPDRGLCCAGRGRMLAAAGGGGGLVNDTAVHVWLLPPHEGADKGSRAWAGDS